MPRRNLILPLVALAVLVVFALVLVRLLALRFERGDVYPAYSTLRADPFGTRAYYEALGSLDGCSVARGYSSLHRELSDEPKTLFFLGLESSEILEFSPDEVSMLDDFVKKGGRVVITLQPEDPLTVEEKKEKDEDDKDSKDKSPDKTESKSGDKDKTSPKEETPPEKPAPDDNAGPQTQQEKYERDELRREDDEDNAFHPKAKHPTKYHRSIAALWGFGWDTFVEKEAAAETKSDNAPESDDDDTTRKKEKPEVLAVRRPVVDTEATVPWKSALYFVRLEPQWQILYDAKENPVAIRRSWGKGEIIVATDSYFLSNEALRNARCPKLLRQLAGPGGEMLFDETHLGTQVQESVMYLAEKYRLEGYLYGMLISAVLLLWRNSVPLVPPIESAKDARLGGAISGKDSRSGLVNLLRRNIAPGEILKTSFAEWCKHVTAARPNLVERTKEMESVLATADLGNTDKIIASYHQLRQINNPSHARNSHATKS